MANNPKPTTIRLGKRDVDLRFDMEAIVALNDRGVNLYAFDSYMNFPPTKLRDMVWAAQLHYEKDALSVQEVTKLLPVGIDDFLEVAKAVSAAMRLALLKPEPAKK